MVATEEKTLTAINAPDFYWQYRLERLAQQKAGDLVFKATSYPEAKTAKELYDEYYLDLTLQGKLQGFDWVGEKALSDSEWLAIYKSICSWSSTTIKANKPSTSNLASNEFDLLKQFYPQLNYRELETPFTVEEVGASFPYKNAKELFSAAASGNLKIATNGVTAIDASEIRKEVAALKEKTLKKVDAIYEQSLVFAKNSLPDEESRQHYKSLRAELATFPQTSSEWSTYRASVEKTVDEMSLLAAKLDEEEHHDHHADEHAEPALSPAEEFQRKYGKNLDDMQEMMSKYKQNPEAFFESSVLEKYGKTGLDILTKSQEFSAKLSVLSEADKNSAEVSFKDFLKSA